MRAQLTVTMPRQPLRASPTVLNYRRLPQGRCRADSRSRSASIGLLATRGRSVHQA